MAVNPAPADLDAEAAQALAFEARRCRSAMECLSRTVLERELELDLVDLGLERARQDTGGLLVFEGAAGIGKTRILEAARERALAADFGVLTARCSRAEQIFPYAVVRQLFESALTDQDDRGHPPPADGPSWIAEAVLPRAQPARDEATEPVLHGLYSRALQLTVRRPLLIAVDDLQWADFASLRCLGYLVRRLGRLRSVVVATTTPIPDAPAHGMLEGLICDASAETVRIEPLSEHAAGELIAAATGVDPQPAFTAACHCASGGNPLILREIVAEVVRHRIRPTNDEAANASELGVRSVAHFILSHFHALPPGARALAEAVAVLGDGVSYRRAAELAKLDYEQAGAAARSLIDSGILKPSTSLTFAHGVAGVALRCAIDPARRDALHDEAARVLDRFGASVDQVAARLLDVEPKGDEWIVDRLRCAAHKAMRAGDLERAASYLRRAVSEPPPGAVARDLISVLGAVEAHCGIGQGLERLRSVVHDPEHPLRRERGLELGQLLTLTGDPAEAISVLEIVRPDVANEEMMERLELTLATAECNQLSTAQEGAGRLRHAAAGAAAPTGALLAAQALVSAAGTGRSEPAISATRRALASMRDRDERDPVAMCLAGSALTWSGRLDLARGVWEQFAADARADGSRLVLAAATWFASHAAYREGAIAKAHADASAALELLSERTWGAAAPLYAVAFAVDALVELGQLEAASERLSNAGLAAGVPEIWPANFVLDARGKLKLAARRYEEALDDFLECGRRLETWGVTNPGVIAWRAHAAAALIGAGRPDEALDLARDELERARRVGAPAAIGVALHAVGLARGAPGTRDLREATELLRSSDAVLDLARAVTDLGAVLSRAGKRREARKPLHLAVELAGRCGATALRDRAHDELLTAGARPRSLHLRGPAALTARERGVAALAAQGLTNKRIADSIFLSEKTVELHLRNAYEKLGINGRAALPRVLDTEEQAVGDALPEAASA